MKTSLKKREAMARWRINNRAKARAATERYRLENPVGRLLSAAKSRAKRDNIRFELKPIDVSIPEFCPVLGIRITIGGSRHSSPSIDRIENSKGYIRGNVIVISDRANRLKGDATLLELQRIADFYTRRVLEDGHRRFEAGLR